MEEVRKGCSLPLQVYNFLFQVSAFVMGLGVQEVLGYLCIFANGLSKLPQVFKANLLNCHSNHNQSKDFNVIYFVPIRHFVHIRQV